MGADNTSNPAFSELQKAQSQGKAVGFTGIRQLPSTSAPESQEKQALTNQLRAAGASPSEIGTAFENNYFDNRKLSPSTLANLSSSTSAPAGATPSAPIQQYAAQKAQEDVMRRRQQEEKMRRRSPFFR